MIKLATVLIIIGCLLSTTVLAADTTAFVSVSGTKLTLNEQEWAPIGMNLMDHETIWDVKKTAPTAKWLRDKDFSDLQRSGFNSVRLVVKSDYFQEVAPPYKFSDKGFKWLDNIVALAKRHKIKLIIDMHMPTGGVQQDYQINDNSQIFWNDPWMKGRFVDVWREIARRYSDESTIWAYDILNEPATTDFKAYQNLVRDTINSIRLNDNNHVILLQKGMKINDDGSWSMDYPQTADANVARSVHFFEPTEFTLQGASWLPTSTVPTFDSIDLNGLLNERIETARSSTHVVLLTEFGTLWPKKLTGQPDWIIGIAKLASDLKIGWHYWHYSGPTCSQSFGLKTLAGTCHPWTYNKLTDIAKTKN